MCLASPWSAVRVHYWGIFAGLGWAAISVLGQAPLWSGHPGRFSRVSLTLGGCLACGVVCLQESWEPSQQPELKGVLVNIGPWVNPFGDGWNPCVAAQRVWRDERIRRNYFGCGAGFGAWG